MHQKSHTPTTVKKTFSDKNGLHNDPDLFIWTPLAADITGDGIDELIWAAAGGTLAYHTLETVGQNELQSSSYFYPNPTTGNIRISTGNTVPASIAVYSLSGRLILTAEETLPANLDLSGLISGTYLLKVVTPDGSFSRKLIMH
ncbi:MAG: T9SS C-terminal target domain-containing protein [Saprospirales bacterium]|nr:MAG: T9SS C-terminal target domain-containing protein [Saprospirales bacterium]